MEELLTEQFLFNHEAETTVLGIFLADNSFLKETILSKDNFYLKKHQLLFGSMKKLSEEEKPVDIVSLVEDLGARIESIGGVGYISDLFGSMTSIESFKYYESLIIARWKKRASIALINDFKDHIYKNDETLVINDLVSGLNEIEEKGFSDEFDLKQLLMDMYNDYSEEKPDINGVRTGYDELDVLTGGLQKEDLIIIAARPSIGKTAFALNLARNICNNGDVVGFFSLEMGERKLAERIWSAQSNIATIKFRNPVKFFTKKEWDDLSMSMRLMIERMNLHIYDKANVTTQEIYSKARNLKNKYKDKNVVIMIDYLQLINGSPNHKGNRVAEISEISRQLKLMARDLNITVIALSQLNRAVEQRQNKRPTLSDIRDSGSIEQDADVIGFLYRDDYYDKDSENKNLCEFIISKQRNGPLGAINFVFLKEYSKFLTTKGG